MPHTRWQGQAFQLDQCQKLITTFNDPEPRQVGDRCHGNCQMVDGNCFAPHARRI